MRFGLAVILFGVCALALGSPYQEPGGQQYGSRKSFRVADKQFLQRQKDVLRLFRFINQPTYYKDQLQLAKSYTIESNLDNYADPQAVKQFLYYYRSGFLPRGQIFSVFYEEQLQQAIALFKVFYSAKDYDTFYKTAVWARYFVNEGLYLYSLSVAILHRPDTYGFTLPPIYEIYPYYFYNTEVIQQAQQYKQLYGEQFGKGKSQDGSYYINSNYSGWYLNVNPEQSLSYYTEDIGINAYYYYYNLYRPFWLNQNNVYFNSYQRGEEFYYFYQQLLARYYLERLSNNQGEIGIFDYEYPIATGYTPSLQYPNGLQFPERPNWAQFGKNFYNYGQSYSFKSKYGYSYTLVQDYERRIRDSIDAGFIITEDGQKLNLFEPTGFNTLGNIIEGNRDSPNRRFYGYLQIFARHLLGYARLPLNKYQVAPSALEHFETSLRDPIFYQFYKRLILYFQKYKYYLPYYTYDDLAYPGVKIEDIQIDRLITYFENYETDISNAAYYSEQEYEGSFGAQIRVRQQRLNHKPFNYKINLVSEQAGQAVIRVYLGPKYDEYGRYLDINENRINFVELDRFKYELQSGKNVIERNSYQIYGGDRYSYQRLYEKVDSALNGAGDYKLYGNEAQYAYPNRYLLPKGKPGGQTYQLYVIVSPYRPYQLPEQQQQRQQLYQGQSQQGQQYYYPFVGLGIQNIDSYALGYPFDRPIDQYSFYVPNAYFKDVVIYLKNLEDVNVAAQN